jgi:hypothetical protein
MSNVLGPGIVSLFVQGLETGLVLSQFSQWLSLERKEGITITVLVLFVTTVGLSAHSLSFLLRVCFLTWLTRCSVETAICFFVCMENLRSSFRTSCEQMFFPCTISGIVLCDLTRSFHRV